MTSTQPTSKYITINDVRIRYFDWGTEGLPPLVCLHGHTGQAHIWDEFAEVMRGSYHVYALDQRGHGKSGYASDGYARDRFVEDLAAFVDTLGLGRFTLAGLSMGGWHSMLYTADHPDRVERIVMVDIGPEPSETAKAGASERPVTPMEFSEPRRRFRLDALFQPLGIRRTPDAGCERQDEADSRRQLDLEGRPSPLQHAAA